MGKLHIIHLKRVFLSEWELRFIGHQADFLRMIEDLKDERCQWNPDAYSGKGAWLVDKETLLNLADKDRFDNVWACYHREIGREELEQRRRSNALVTTMLRDANYLPPENINDCPF